MQNIFVTYDINQTIPLDMVSVTHVNDCQTRVLEVALFEGKDALSVAPECTVQAAIVTRKTKSLLKSGVACEVNEAGHLLVPIDDLHYRGKMDIHVEITITDATHHKVLTLPYPLWVRVNPSILDDAAVTEDSLGTVPELLENAAYALEHFVCHLSNEDKQEIAEMISVPTKTSDLINDSGFLTAHQDISGKQDKLARGSSNELVDAGEGGVMKRSGYRVSNNEAYITDSSSAAAWIPTAQATARKLSGTEKTSNKVTAISSSPTDAQYPSALAVKHYVDTVIGGIENGAY